MRRFGWVLAFLGCTGCAALTRSLASQYNPETGEYETPREEVVYLVPIEDAMMTARRVLEEQRYDVLEKEGGLEMFSSAHEPGKNDPGLRNIERYYVKGHRMGPRQSLVRIYRLSYSEMETGVEEPPPVSNSENSRDAKVFNANAVHPFDTRMEAFTTTPGGASGRQVVLRNPFPNAPGQERFRYVRGIRDMGIETRLQQRLEVVPALEVVSGNAPVPMRSVLMEDAGEAVATLPPDCDALVEGATPLLLAGQVLLVADPLGTREVPTAALRMLCEATTRGLPVTLALSVPSTEQPSLEAYVASKGLTSDAQALLSGSGFWRRTYQDGRSSRATLWLVEHARRLRAYGKDVAVVAIDTSKAQGDAREAEMARNLLAFRATRPPTAWTLVLAGSVHARTTKVGWNDDLEPLGARLAKALPSAVRSLDVGFRRGTQFACRFNVWENVECNVFAISPTNEVRQADEEEPGVQLATEPRPDGFHGRLYLGALSASPPALQTQRQFAAVPAPKE
ncbi:hypothetical protein LZ198_33070 [Myxococcus sp. K15C18031901]|uniref:hypothetical protein n=1 Tax=Myxococcus dinghuensis TaxID=2906761 RepID=UPI0020A7B0DA|nr:hypothetical protein [Myxococcus dinghuensis]MCP3103726.1 hypothetical protein [Myxococcus dinghuensis]